MGQICKSDSQNKTAIQHLEKALEIAREHGFKEQEAQIHLWLEHCFRSDNQNPSSIQHCKKSLEITKDQGNKLLETAAYLCLGDCFRSHNQNQEAIQHYQNGLEIAREQGYKLQETQVYFKLALAYTSDNEIQTAIQYYEKIIKIAREQGYKLQETHANIKLGEVYKSESQDKTAIEHLEKALEIAREHGFKEQEAQIHLWLEHCFRSNKQNPSSIEQSKKTLESGSEQGYKNVTANPTNELSIYADTSNEEKTHEKLNNFLDQTALSSRAPEIPASWKWVERSIIHREKSMKLHEYAKHHPNEIHEVNGVRVCCSKEFLIGKGSDGTRVYVGLGKDGIEKAVKRLPRDACSSSAEQEKKVLNELNTKESQHVVNYWFLEEQNDKHYLFLILDLCEETLKNFVQRSSDTELVTYAPDIIQQVLKGLVDLHQGPNPILHRDLKPTNILRNIQDNWLLADFGISRILTEDVTTYESLSRGAEDWKAVESWSFKGATGDSKSSNVYYKKESDIQVAGMVAFYIVTKGEHPFGEKPDRLRNLIDGKAVGLDKLKDDAAKDLIAWMLNHNLRDRPSAAEALKHPYLQPAKQQFEMLCKVGNQQEIKAQDLKSDVVRKLNSNPEDWRSKIAPDVLKYLSTDYSKGKTFSYRPSWTYCLRLMRNVEQHWNERPSPRPEVFYTVEDPQKYFLNLFPSLCVEVHKIIRSCDWKERVDLKEYFA